MRIRDEVRRSLGVGGSGSTKRSGEGAMRSIDPALAGQAAGEANPVGRPIFDPDRFRTLISPSIELPDRP